MYKIRGLRPDDIGFITSTWLKNYREKSKFAKSMKKDIYFKEHNKAIHDALINFETLVVCSDKDETHIFSFLNGNHQFGYDVVNYFYQKKVYEGTGLMGELMKAFKRNDVCMVTHESKEKELDSYYHAGVFYNPYMFLNGGYFG